MSLQTFVEASGLLLPVVVLLAAEEERGRLWVLEPRLSGGAQFQGQASDLGRVM